MVHRKVPVYIYYPQLYVPFFCRGKLVTFYKSGDKHYKGLPMSVSQKQFVTFKTLLDFLSSKIPTTKGVKTVFSWPDCKVGQLCMCACPSPMR